MNNLEHVNVDIAAEHMIDSGFEKLVDEKNIMPLTKSYLLIEMSYLQASIKTALWLLKNNLIDFMASDVHKISQLNYLKKISINEKTLMLIKPVIEKTIYNFK